MLNLELNNALQPSTKMSTASTKYVHLAPNRKSAYRQLFVKGTRIPARAPYGWYACEEPLTPAEIAADYNLPLEAVTEAIALNAHVT